MVHSALEAVSFLFLAMLGTTGGTAMMAVGAMLLVLRWMLRDKDRSAGAATHS